MNFNSELREYVSDLRRHVIAPSDLHQQVMDRIGRPPDVPARRGRVAGQLVGSLALITFVAVLGFGISHLRDHRQAGGITGTTPSATPIPTAARTPRETAIPGPPGRFGAAMAFDAKTGVVLAFGGQGTDGFLADTWSWNGSGWTELHPAASPSGRVGAKAVYDEATGMLLLYGGSTSSGPISDLWAWDGQRWKQLNPQHTPPPRAGASLTYDRRSRIVLLFGGDSGDRTPLLRNDLWAWNGSDWMQESPVTVPPARSDAALVFDEASGLTILFGGTNGTPLNDTWAWTGRTWSPVMARSSPAGRYGASAVYDEATESIVLFGGAGFENGASETFADTWMWAGTTWQRVSESGPSARWLSTMAYDPERRAVVLFGGPAPSKTASTLGDTWLWNGSAWKLQSG